MKAQEKGKVIKENISPGTKVMVRIEPRTKLGPVYNGPFVIASKTAAGNYKLQNASGKWIKGSFPTAKLKVIDAMEREAASRHVFREPREL